MKLPKIRLNLFAILLVQFSGSLGFGLVIPFLVVLVNRFGGDAFMFGVIGSIYPAFQFVGSSVLGYYSDVFGRKPTLLISQIGTVVGWIIFLFALFLPTTHLFSFSSTVTTFILTVPLLIIALARAIDGITGGNISIAQAYLADITTEKERSKDYGMLQVASNLGYIVGPALAGIMASTALGEKLPVIAAVVVSLLAALFIWLYLPESHKKLHTEKLDTKKVTLSDALSQKYILYLLSMYFLLYIGYNIYYTAFPLNAIGPLHWSVGKMGLYFSVLSFLMVVVQGPVLSRVSKIFSESKLILAGTFFMGINFLLIVTQQDALIFLSAAFFALGNGLMWPSLLSVISKFAGSTYQGTIQGLSGSLAGAASIIGLIGGGILFQHFSGGTFYISAGLFFLVVIMSLRLFSFEK